MKPSSFFATLALAGFAAAWSPTVERRAAAPSNGVPCYYVCAGITTDVDFGPTPLSNVQIGATTSSCIFVSDASCTYLTTTGVYLYNDFISDCPLTLPIVCSLTPPAGVFKRAPTLGQSRDPQVIQDRQYRVTKRVVRQGPTRERGVLGVGDGLNAF